MTENRESPTTLDWFPSFGGGRFAEVGNHKVTHLGATKLYIVEQVGDDQLPERTVLVTASWAEVADYLGLVYCG